MDTFSVQPTVTKIWKGHTARAGYEYRYQKWNITNAGYPARTVPLQRILHPCQQRRRASTTRHRRGRSSCSGCRRSLTNTVASRWLHVQPVRDCVPGGVHPGQPRLVPAGRLAGQQPADAQRGRPARVHARPARVAGSPGRPVRFRHPQPDRGGGARRLRRQPDPRAAAECSST